MKLQVSCCTGMDGGKKWGSKWHDTFYTVKWMVKRLLELPWLGDIISNQVVIHFTSQRNVWCCYGNPRAMARSWFSQFRYLNFYLMYKNWLLEKNQTPFFELLLYRKTWRVIWLNIVFCKLVYKKTYETTKTVYKK